jgi:hypothetical protein
MGGCGNTGTHVSNPIYSSDIVLYNGGGFPCLNIPPNSTLNEVMVLIGAYLCNLSNCPTSWTTDDITLVEDLNCTGGTIGMTLTEYFEIIDKLLCGIDVGSYVQKSLYDAFTVLVADTDDTPIALNLPVSTILGRGTGNIQALSVADVLHMLSVMNVDGNSVFPYVTALPYSVGHLTTADKVMFVINEGAVFANNPYLSWVHTIFGDSGETLLVTSKDSISQAILCESVKEDSYIGAVSGGTGSDVKDQELILGDQTGILSTRRYWALRKDGADSRALKLVYWNGTSETTALSVDVTNKRFVFNSTAPMTGMLDDDTMIANSAYHTISQQSFLAYFAAHAVSQVEMDDTQTGAGLGTDGSYTPPAGSTYLAGATDLNNADYILDGEIKSINDKIDSATNDAGFLQLCAKASFEYSDLPTTGTIGLIGSPNIPTNAIITSFRCDVITAFTDDGSNVSTIGIGIESMTPTIEDVKVSAAIGTDFTTGVKTDSWNSFVPTTPLKLSAARDFSINVILAGGATTLLTGKLYVYVTYFITE